VSGVDRALVRIGRVVGKPPGWERVVHALAPPSRFAGTGPHPTPMPEGYLFPVDPGTLLGWHVHFFGSYEPEVRAEIKRRLHPGDTAVDVGANVGWHALLMAATVGSTGRVFAFEPNDTTRARLTAAIDGNGLTQVVVDARAVADRSGPGAFEAPPAGAFWDGTGRLTRDAVNARRVECVTLDAFVQERGIERLAFMKIDVEGFELSVLRGAARTLATLGPAIVFEYDPAYVSRCGGSGEELTACLSDADYELFLLDPRRPPSAVRRLAERGGNVLALRRAKGRA
jgi:FkbM family methyltransferase